MRPTSIRKSFAPLLDQLDDLLNIVEEPARIFIERAIKKTEAIVKQSRLGDFVRQRVTTMAESGDDSVGAVVTRVARAAGITPGTLNDIMNGVIPRPPDARLRRLASPLGTSFNTLVNLIPPAIRNRPGAADRPT